MANDARTKTWWAMLIWRSTAKNRGWLCLRGLHWRTGSSPKWITWPRPDWRLWAMLWCPQWQTLGPMSFPVAPFSKRVWFQACWSYLRLNLGNSNCIDAQNLERLQKMGLILVAWFNCGIDWKQVEPQLWVFHLILATALFMWLSPNLEQDHQAQTCVWLA